MGQTGQVRRLCGARGAIFAAFLAASCWLLGCSHQSQPPVWDAFYGGRLRQVMAEQRELAQKPKSKDRALAMANCASAALALGEYDAAKEALRSAGEIMWDFSAEGEFRSTALIGGKEELKIYKGDPYEKAMAAYYRGLICYMQGDLQNARAMFKRALLADAGTRLEQYRSDFTTMYLMLGRVSQDLGESQEAERYYRLAKSAARSRFLIGTVSDAITSAWMQVQGERSSKDRKALKEAAEHLLSQLYVGPYDESSPIVMLREMVIKSLNVKPEKMKSDPAKVWEYIRLLGDVAAEMLDQGGSEPSEAVVDRLAAIDRVSDPKTNVLLMVDIGVGPYKTRAGEYGSLAVICAQSYNESYCVAEVGGAGEDAAKSVCLDDIYYQASTRGGREMDALLKGKAVFRGALDTASQVSSQMSRGFSQAPYIGGGFAIISLVFMLVGQAIHPEADIRCWRTLPGEIHVVPLALPPGTHQVTLKFFDAYGMELPRFAQTKSVVVPKNSGTTVFYARCIRGVRNQQN